MIKAAALTTRPVWASPSDTARRLSPRASHDFAHARDEEDLVVHREAEEHGEEEDRHPALDLRDAIEAEHVGPDAEAEDHDEQSVGGGDGDGVECHGHQREHEGPEGAQQHEIGEREHEQDDPGKRSVDAAEEVGPLSRRTADVDAEAGREAGSGKEPGADLVHEQLGRFLAEVVPPDDDHLAVPAGGVDVGRSGADGNDEDLRIVQELVGEPERGGGDGRCVRLARQRPRRARPRSV